MKKICVNKKIKCGILFSILAVMLIIVLLIFKYQRNDKKREYKENIFEYTYSPEGSYLVNLVNNNYYDNEIMGEGEKYIYNLVNTVDVSFSGDYVGSQKSDILMEYQMKGRIDGYQLSSGNKDIIIQKEMDLSELKTEKYNDFGCGYEVSKNINIKDYEAMLANVKGEFGITLTLSLTVYVEGKITIKNENMANKEIPIMSEVTIPLNSTLFSIDKQLGSPVNEQITVTKNKIIKPNIKYTILGIILVILLGIGEVLVYIFLIGKSEEKIFSKEEKSVLKKYRGRLVALSGMPDVCINEIYVVEDVTDLLKISEELVRPVMYVRGQCEEVEGGKIFVIEGTNKYVCFI